MLRPTERCVLGTKPSFVGKCYLGDDDMTETASASQHVRPIPILLDSYGQNGYFATNELQVGFVKNWIKLKFHVIEL
jgi:hypothetical protein